MSGDFSFLKGNIYTIILCSLYDKDGHSGDKYGYEIAKEIKERTDNKYEIKQPTLYAYLKKLEQQDLIESYWGTESNGGRRRYYKLTPKGRHDCEQFMAEWEYHKTVLSTLVDSPDGTTVTVSQEDVTPLFGEKRKKSKPVRTVEMDEQDEISRRLDELLGGQDSSADPYNVSTKDPSKLEQTSLFDDFEEDQPQDTATDLPTENVQQTVTEEDALAKFAVNQDSAEDFLQEFDQRAQMVSESFTATSDSSENYQHTLMKMLGEQLDEMDSYHKEQSEGAKKYYTDHPVALEDVADSMAQQGIRMRLYNGVSSTFKSKTLMPIASVLCKSAWITFAFAAVFFGVLLFLSISNNNWQPFLITLAVILLIPIAATVFALSDPSRKDKPRFMFKRFLIGTVTLAVIIILFALSISIITKIELNNFAAVSKQILIPTGIALLLPIFVVVFNCFYKKY